MRRTTLGLSLILAVLAGGCGGDDPPASIDAARPDARLPPDAIPPDAGNAGLPEDLPSPLPTGPVDVRLMTFNIGQLQTVRGGRERLPHQITAIAASGADIVCLQEVYVLPDPEERYLSPLSLATELSDVYPYAAWDWATTGTVSNGLLIVSKVPLYRQRFHRFTMNDGNGVVDRAVLAATAVGDAWHLDVLCTHLQAGVDPLNSSIRASQLVELGTFTTEHGYADGPSLLLGDLNAGPLPVPAPEEPECPGQGDSCPATCAPVDTATLATLTGSGAGGGWTDRADALGFSPCTYCKPHADALALLPLFACDGSQRIDHCLARGLGPADITALDRVLDAIDLNIPMPGDLIARTLSDHFAVACTLGTPP